MEPRRYSGCNGALTSNEYLAATSAAFKLPAQLSIENVRHPARIIDISMRPHPPVNKPNGFTLLELLVVMVIIGLLASYVAPRFFDQVGKSEVKATRAQLDAFEKALGAYRLDTGHFPTTEQGLRALVERPADEPRWSKPYLSKALPSDPWGRAYIYRSPGEQGRDYDLLSLGKDGQIGGADENADISVWDTGR